MTKVTNRVPKTYITHDQSFKVLASNISMNNMIATDEFEPSIYGFMFLRLLHMIHTMRSAFHSHPILICKYNLDSTYRHLHMNTYSTIKCLCTTAVCALIYLHLTFEGVTSPSKWCITIDIITNPACDIADNPFWCHKSTTASEHNPSQLPEPSYLHPDIPFIPALPFDVYIILSRHSWIGSYVDGMISVYVNTLNNTICTTKVILLTIFIPTHPSSSSPHLILHTYLLYIHI